jgi:hypothetical protein
VSLVLASLSIAAAVYTGAGQQMFPTPSFLAVTIVLLFVVTALSFFLLYKAKDPSAFLQSYLLSTTFKLLGYGGYNVIMIFSDRDGATANVLLFMLTYLAFTVLEIVFLYRKFSRPRGR